jgi:uncharacterized membrane protein YfcA
VESVDGFCLHTGNKRFRELLPWLLLFAAVMFVLSFPLGRWLASLSDGRRYNTWLIIGMVVVSVYVGYFGAGGGFLAMALVRHLRRPRHSRNECPEGTSPPRFPSVFQP